VVALTRLFVAAEVTTEARHALAALVDGVDVPGRRVRPPNWHLTLRFIGEVDEPMLDLLIRSLDEADLGDRFRVRWGALGAFPRPSKATVVWVDLTEGVPQLTALAGSVESAVTAAGVAAEDRPFRPHLTLSRIRPPVDVRDLIGSVSPTQVTMPIDRVLLMSSRRQGRETRYEQVESFDLA
jgi:2'-5' RNA ligase